MRAGDWILAHRAVPREDLFSFTIQGHAGCDWEWGSDAIYALLHRWNGLSAIVTVSMTMLGLMSILVYRTACFHARSAVAFTVTCTVVAPYARLPFESTTSWSVYEIDKALALDPASPQGNANHAGILSEMHHYDDAMAELNKLIAANPNFPPFYGVRSDVYWVLGNQDAYVSDRVTAIKKGADGRSGGIRYRVSQRQAEGGLHGSD